MSKAEHLKEVYKDIPTKEQLILEKIEKGEDLGNIFLTTDQVEMLEKGHSSGLVQKKVTIKNKNGGTHQAIRWVKPDSNDSSDLSTKHSKYSSHPHHQGEDHERIQQIMDSDLKPTNKVRRLVAEGIYDQKTLGKLSEHKYPSDIASMVKKEVNVNVHEFKHPNEGLPSKKGKDAIDLLVKLGYDVELFYAESGRTFLSKGFLKQAKKLAEKNSKDLYKYSKKGLPILGLEPSAILSFRDEYKRMSKDKEIAQQIADHSFLIEEFLANEILEKRIDASVFNEEEKIIKIHNHCHQKALSNQKVTFDVLNLPVNYKVTIIASGCCGMAGSFGYEKEHYDVSMKVGGLKLFPAVNKANSSTIIAANGTSCRHQIFDGTKRVAMHPVSILKKALLV